MGEVQEAFGLLGEIFLKLLGMLAVLGFLILVAVAHGFLANKFNLLVSLAVLVLTSVGCLFVGTYLGQWLSQENPAMLGAFTSFLFFVLGLLGIVIGWVRKDLYK